MGSTLLFGLRWLGNFINVLAPTVVGIFLGGVLIKRYWVRKSNESLIIEYLARELDSAVHETLEYWSMDCSGSGAKQDEIRRNAKKLEQRIKGDLINLLAALRNYSERYCPMTNFDTNAQELYDACTNGQFEVNERASDPHRFLHVVNAAHRVRWQLFDRRI